MKLGVLNQTKQYNNVLSFLKNFLYRKSIFSKLFKFTPSRLNLFKKTTAWINFWWCHSAKENHQNVQAIKNTWSNRTQPPILSISDLVLFVYILYAAALGTLVATRSGSVWGWWQCRQPATSCSCWCQMGLCTRPGVVAKLES